jgi:hypothetical protein
MRLEPGIEAGSASLVGPDLRLIVDQSAFADTLSEYDSRPGFNRRREQIAGESADVLSFRADDGTNVVAVRLSGGLTAVVHASPDVDTEVPLRILRSLSIHQ